MKCTDCICSCKSKYHTIMIMTTPSLGRNEWVSDCCLTQNLNASGISWWEQVTFNEMMTSQPVFTLTVQCCAIWCAILSACITEKHGNSSHSDIFKTSWNLVREIPLAKYN
jgi:hypothetical protein